MRSPNGPLFGRSETLDIVAFVLAAIAISGLKLVY